jgi:hypothetical protein
MKFCPDCGAIVEREEICVKCGASTNHKPPVAAVAHGKKKRTLGLFALPALVVSAALATFFILRSASSAGRPASNGAWAEAKRWEGSGTRQTESFTMTGPEWRIRYKTVASTQAQGVFQIYVHDAESRSVVTVAANRIGDGADVSYVKGRRNGRYFLRVSATSSWVVTAEDKH